MQRGAALAEGSDTTRPSSTTATLLLAVVLAVALAGSTTSARSETHRVEPDGTGDFATIQTAINNSRDGDVIELGSGTFSGAGNRDIRFQGKAIILQSVAGDPSKCIIDCENLAVGFRFSANETPATTLRGVTIARGLGTVAGGVYIESADPTIERCAFLGNVCANGPGGGGVNAFDSYAAIVGCHFEANHTYLGGAAVYCKYGALLLQDCMIVDNDAADLPFLSGGGLFSDQASPRIEGCTIARNFVHAGAGGLFFGLGGSPVVRNCTMVANVGDAVVVSVLNPMLMVENSIIAFNEAPGVACDGGVSFACSDLFGNTGGDWVQCAADQSGNNGNIAADPAFCGLDSAYYVDESSPCAPAHSQGCGLIGAWEVGCGGVPVLASSWGALKARYRF